MVTRAGEEWMGTCAWEGPADLLCVDDAFPFHSLTKDMTGKEDNYRGPAVRALCQITDVSLLPPSSSHSPSLLLAKAQS